MITLTDATFDAQFEKHCKDCIILFHAEFAGPSIAMRKTLQEIETDIGVNVLIVDINRCVETARKYDIKAVPTVYFYENHEVKRAIKGALTRSKIEELVNL